MKLLLTVFLSMALISPALAAELQWLTDLPAAVRQASAENKAILVNFTGSDWCGWCIKLKKEVFDKPAFAAFARDNLVLVEVDFPRAKKLPEDLRKANDDLAGQFAVQGFPTIFILDSQGRRLARAGYMPGGPENYIAKLATIPGFVWNIPPAAPETPAPAESPTPAGVPSAANAPSTTAPAQPNYTPPAVIRYEELALKGITGGSRKTALINNQSFFEGETSSVKLGDKQLLIRCKEIKTDSVIVEVEGESEPRELRLKSAGAAK